MSDSALFLQYNTRCITSMPLKWGSLTDHLLQAQLPTVLFILGGLEASYDDWFERLEQKYTLLSARVLSVLCFFDEPMDWPLPKVRGRLQHWSLTFGQIVHRLRSQCLRKHLTCVMKHIWLYPSELNVTVTQVLQCSHRGWDSNLEEALFGEGLMDLKGSKVIKHL